MSWNEHSSGCHELLEIQSFKWSEEFVCDPDVSLSYWLSDKHLINLPRFNFKLMDFISNPVKTKKLFDIQNIVAQLMSASLSELTSWSHLRIWILARKLNLFLVLDICQDLSTALFDTDWTIEFFRNWFDLFFFNFLFYLTSVERF